MRARVRESADLKASKAFVRKDVRVRIPPRARKKRRDAWSEGVRTGVTSDQGNPWGSRPDSPESIRSWRLGKSLLACGIRGSSPIKCYVLGVAMHRSIRFLALATLAIGVIALPMVLPGSSAYAKSKSKTGVTVKCTALSGVFIAPLPETFIISGCSQTQATGGTGTLSCPENGFCPPGLVTWTNRLGTTTLKFGQRTIFAGDPKNKCPNANDTEEIWKGGGTRSSPAGRSPGVSGSVSAKVCVEPLSPGSTDAVFSLVPGSRFKL
jgi:hypothetical protein